MTTPTPNPVTSSSAPARGDRPALSREVVVEAAIGVVDERGLDGLTMRNLGAALGVDAMTIYGYVANKAALVDAVVEHEVARMRVIPHTDIGDPIEYLVHAGHHYRNVMLDHPHLAAHVAARPLPLEDWATTIPAGVALLQAAGFHDDDIGMVGQAIVRFTLGFVVLEAAEQRYRDSLGEELEPYLERVREQAEAFGGTATPEGQAMARRHDPSKVAEEFDAGMRGLVAGLLANLAANRAARQA